MTINFTDKCESCSAGIPSNNCQEIGQSVHIDGGRAGDTDYRFLQCNSCGTIFLNVRDSGGLGGHGNFNHVLTNTFF